MKNSPLFGTRGGYANNESGKKREAREPTASFRMPHHRNLHPVDGNPLNLLLKPAVLLRESGNPNSRSRHLRNLAGHYFLFLRSGKTEKVGRHCYFVCLRDSPMA